MRLSLARSNIWKTKQQKKLTLIQDQLLPNEQNYSYRNEMPTPAAKIGVFATLYSA